VIRFRATSLQQNGCSTHPAIANITFHHFPVLSTITSLKKPIQTQKNRDNRAVEFTKFRSGSRPIIRTTSKGPIMATTEAWITSNNATATVARGPKPPAEVVEVEKRYKEFCEELKPQGSLSSTLLQRAATLAVRMERSAMQQIVASDDRVTRALADLEATEGLDPEVLARRRIETRHLASFDPSKEACLARKYEAAAERGFFRALKEFQQLQKQAKASEPSVDSEEFREMLASFSEFDREADAIEAKFLEQDHRMMSKPPKRFDPLPVSPIGSPIDVPITIGRRR
jgi:hypothetical protein